MGDNQAVYDALQEGAEALDDLRDRLAADLDEETLDKLREAAVAVWDAANGFAGKHRTTVAT